METLFLSFLCVIAGMAWWLVLVYLIPWVVGEQGAWFEQGERNVYSSVDAIIVWIHLEASWCFFGGGWV